MAGRAQLRRPAATMNKCPTHERLFGTKDQQILRVQKQIIRLNQTLERLETPMSYEFTMSARRIESLMGTAYPSATLTHEQRQRFFRQLLSEKHNLEETRYGQLISVKYIKRPLRSTLVRIEIDKNGKEAYRLALSIEKFLWNAPRLGYLSPPRWWNRIVHRRPKDMFLIDHGMLAEVVDWLQENCRHRDYQFISKFKHDITLGFRSEEAATLFKLTFGDKDLISKDAH